MLNEKQTYNKMEEHIKEFSLLTEANERAKENRTSPDPYDLPVCNYKDDLKVEFSECDP